MPSEHLIPTECEGALEKPELTQNVRETVEYADAVADPEIPQLMKALDDLAVVGKRLISGTRSS